MVLSCNHATWDNIEMLQCRLYLVSKRLISPLLRQIVNTVEGDSRSMFWESYKHINSLCRKTYVVCPHCTAARTVVACLF
jgi:hypothetical protein